MDIKKIEKVIELMLRHGIHEIDVKDGDEEIRVVNQPVVSQWGGSAQIGALTQSIGGGSATGTTQGAKTPDNAMADNFRVVKSQLVGTLYMGPSPGADPFVTIGSRVKKGDTLCIIEAMKYMNEIESDLDGTVRQIFVDNEQPVEFDQALFAIEPG